MYDGYTKYDAEQARTYDAEREGEAHWHAEAAFIASYLADANATRLIDVPVGTGRFLSNCKRAEAVYGVDVSDEMLKVALDRVRNERLSNVSLIRGSVLSLPFTQRSFDVAVCCRLMHLLPAHLLVEALRELRRVTSKEMIIQVYVRGSLIQRVWYRLVTMPDKVIRQLWKERASKYPWSHIRAYSHEERVFRTAITEAGLIVSRCVHLCYYRGNSVRFFVLRVE